MTGDDDNLSTIQLAVTSAALDGDAAAIYHLVSDLLGEGMPFESVLIDVLSPVQNGLGDRWQYGDYLVSEEHAASSAIETVVSLLAGSFEQPEEGFRVVISCVEGDRHSLPGRFLAALLVSRGFRTVYLGATMPAADLQRFLVQDPPDALALTCTMTNHLPGAYASIAAGHEAALPVMVGGEAFGPDGARAYRLGADKWCPDVRSAGDTLETWEPGRMPTGEVVPPPSEYFSLLGARPAIVGAAATAAAGSMGQSARYQCDIELLFDALVAAMLVDEDLVLDDFVGWFVARVNGHGEHTELALAILEALQDALGDEYPQAGYRVSSAAASLAGS